MMKLIKFPVAPGTPRAHIVTSTLVDEIIADLKGRGMPMDDMKVERVSGVFLDLPGMCFANRPTETIKVDAVTFTIPSSEIGYWAEKIASYPVRGKRGKGWIKIHGWLSCVVITSRQRKRLVASLRKIKVDADRRDRAFMDSLS